MFMQYDVYFYSHQELAYISILTAEDLNQDLLFIH